MDGHSAIDLIPSFSLRPTIFGQDQQYLRHIFLSQLSSIYNIFILIAMLKQSWDSHRWLYKSEQPYNLNLASPRVTDIECSLTSESFVSD